MLINPFTPSEIAAHPEDFYGRSQELRTLRRSIMQGSVAIQGVVGIGKSSLLSQLRLSMEGFQSDHKAISALAVGHKDIKDVDAAARQLLESFAEVDEKSKKIKFTLPKFLEIESGEVCRLFTAGRHLAGLTRLLERKNMDMLLTDKEHLILAIDEADKCAVPLTRLIRALTTHLQQEGVKRIRFILAGVSPYFQEMAKEDSGISRFFYKVMSLAPMASEDAEELVTNKFQALVKNAERIPLQLRVDPLVISRIVDLSGGHPHVLQLMGSHVVEHENNDPDGIIDSKDLADSLRTICYEDRSYVYESTLHNLELSGQLDTLRTLLKAAGRGFPTRLDRARALRFTDIDALNWLVNNNILTVVADDQYALADEFLRIRMKLDEVEEYADEIENHLLRYGTLQDLPSFGGHTGYQIENSEENNEEP